MKKVFTFLALVLITTSLFPPQETCAQALSKMSYQAVIRNTSNELVANTQVGMQISILQGSAEGTAVYTETQTPTTNANGLVSIEIGTGTTIDDFSAIDWSTGTYFIKTKIATEAPLTTYTITGTSELLSVPYALYAETAAAYTETDPKVGANTENYLSKWDGTALVQSTIFDNGKIGIGTNTPDENLHIKTTTTDGNIKLEVPDGDGYYLGYNSGGEYMAISVINGGTPHWETLNLKSGNVGIGTNDPSKILEISKSSGNGTQIDLIDLNSQNDGLGSGSKIRFRTSNNSNTLARLGVIDEFNFGGAIQFEVNQEGEASDITTEVMRINKSGRVGIGTVTPSTLLDVNGVITATDGNSTNWNTAYGWGNHADAGYLSSGDVITYSVGDFAQGGIVFWVDETGQHGLVCAKEDQDGGSGIQWSNGTFTDTEAHGDGVYAGKMNTMLIIANQGSNSNEYAAGVCANYTVTENGVTYGDWYLPSKEELNLVYQNKATIDATATANGGSSFTNIAYWSSLELDNDIALIQNFIYGNQGNGNKTSTDGVRAVRAF